MKSFILSLAVILLISDVNSIEINKNKKGINVSEDTKDLLKEGAEVE